MIEVSLPFIEIFFCNFVDYSAYAILVAKQIVQKCYGGELRPTLLALLTTAVTLCSD